MVLRSTTLASSRFAKAVLIVNPRPAEPLAFDVFTDEPVSSR
jgi:hypothetical protein